MLLVILSATQLLAQKDVIIFNEYTSSDTVDMGMCMPGDSLITSFIIKNQTSKDLMMANFGPSWGTFQDPGHPNEFDEFNKFKTPLPFNLAANLSGRYYVMFSATTDLLKSKPRKNTIRLRMGLFDPKLHDPILNPPNDTVDMVGFRDFRLIARKTIHNIDVFEQEMKYDSVYINPVDTLRKQLIIQNSWSRDLRIDSTKFYRSPNAEITTDINPMPLKISRYQTTGFQKIWNFAYYPTRWGLDESTFIIYYNPNPTINPDSLDIRQTLVNGVGVEQFLKITNVDSADFTFNSINFGDLDVGDSKTVQAEFQLLGNIPFGALSMRILQIDSDKPAEGYELIRKFKTDRHLQPSENDTIIVRFNPMKADTFRARLVFESDISKRKIWGAPDSVRFRSFYLSGAGRQAEIASLPDTIDFGNIIVNEGGDCPTRRDSNVIISNIGNLRLNAIFKILPDNNDNPFKINDQILNVDGRSSLIQILTFDSIANVARDYEAYLYIYSNSPPNKDTLRIVLRARGIYPDTMDIKFPGEVRNMPGRRIVLPILIDKKKISVAKIFTDTLTYNPTLLDFYRVNHIGTASELAEKIDAKQNSEQGYVAIKIQTRGTERFLQNDTLILIEFDTYLGDNITTPVHFMNPKLSDGICQRVLTLNRIDGKFTLDSVCGLDMKVGKHSNSRFKLLAPNPNPIKNELNLEFEMAFKTNSEIRLYNTFGEVVKVLVNNELPEGIYTRTYNIENLSSGLYLLEMRAGIFHDVKQIVISK